MADFTPSNLGHQARQWLELLALPLPVTLALLSGGFWGALLGMRRFFTWVIVLFCIAPVVYKYAMKELGKRLKDYLELVDRDYLGIDIHIGRLEMSVCSARFVIHDLQLDNPQGYKGEYLLKCKHVILDLDVLELIMSKGKRIVVEEFTLDCIDVMLEYDSVILGAGTSNFDCVMEFMASRGKDDDDSKKQSPAKVETPRTEAAKADAKPPEPGSERQVIIQKVAIVDVGAKMLSAIGVGPRIAVADTRYQHFTEQFKTSSTRDVLQIIFKSIFKSLLANVAGKAFADKSL